MRKTQINKEKLLAEVELQNRELHLLRIALNRYMHEGADGIFRTADYTLHVIDPNGASGGILLVTYHPKCNPDQKPYTSAHYWEEWYSRNVRDGGLAFTCDPEGIALRETAYKVQTWIAQKQRAIAA
jgi:hypothetical protein